MNYFLPGLSLCMKFNLSAEDLFYKWEAFSFNSSVKDRVLSSLTLAGTKDLHQSLLQDRAKATPVSKPPARIAAASARRPPFETPRQPQKNAPPPTRTTVPVSYQTVQVNDQPKWAPFRYMHEKISDRSEGMSFDFRHTEKSLTSPNSS
jgi:DNA polymerase alpha subunit B